jgi:NTP pyrophosphatase (non-canonical NTP hydrolase)
MNNTDQLIENVRQWGRDKGITGPNGKGTLLGQLAKTQEELTETRDAAVAIESINLLDDDSGDYDLARDGKKLDLKDGIGDCTVTLILAAEMAGLDFIECLQAAYNEIKNRKGKMENGVFVKEVKP